MFSRVSLLFLVFFQACQTSPEPLFEYGGKEYYPKDLPSKMQNEIFEIERNRSQALQDKIREAALSLYFEEEAKRLGQSAAEIERRELAVNENPDEEELKKFYESIKSKTPYSYDLLKGELKFLYLDEAKKEKRQALLTKIEKTKGVKIFVLNPDAPSVNISVKNYPRKGKAGSRVQLVEYGDFTCPICQMAAGEVDEVLKKYGERVEFVYKFFLLHEGELSLGLAKGGYCAHKLGQFWTYHKYVFDNQLKALGETPQAIAAKLKLDSKKFEACLKSPDSILEVTKSHEEGQRNGVTKTPTFFINGQQLPSGYSASELEREIEKRL